MSLQPSGFFLIVAILFFYVRLIWLQNRKITLAKQAAGQASDPDKSQQRKPKKEKSYFDKYRFRIINWNILIGAVIIIAAGAIISDSNLLGDLVRSLWWIPTAGGIVILSFSFA